MTLTEEGRLLDTDVVLLERRLSIIASNYLRYSRYLEGKNPTLMDAPPKADPDNRVPVPFAKRIVSTLKGYAYKPGYITYSSPGTFLEILKPIFDSNDEELLTAELADDAMGFGVGYEILRVDPSLGIRQYRADAGTGVPAYDNTIEKNLIAFIHLVTHDDYAQTKTIYYADVYQEWYKENGGSWQYLGETAHPFGQVPVIVYRVNRRYLPVYSAELPLIDEHDKVISSSYADERERFARAYLLLMDELDTSEDADGRTTLQKISEMRAFTGLGRNDNVSRVSDAVGFLTKPSRGSETEEEANRLERLIKENAQIIDPYDPTFSGASGIALAYKLLPMEWLCADMDGYFDRGLQRRIELIGNALGVLFNMGSEMVTIHHRRNVPMDLLNLATVSGLLKGTVSDKTILSLFPGDIIGDVNEELLALQEQGGSIFDDEPEVIT